MSARLRSSTLFSILPLTFALACASKPSPIPTKTARATNVGDACLDDGNETHACSLDHGALLVCKRNKLAKKRHCKGPRHCSMKEKPNDNEIVCDMAIADVGDACDTAGEFPCGMDGTTELVCVGGRFVKKRDCKGKGGCSVRGAALYCAD